MASYEHIGQGFKQSVCVHPCVCGGGVVCVCVSGLSACVCVCVCACASLHGKHTRKVVLEVFWEKMIFLS